MDIVSGCFLMIPRSIWLALGGFDPVYFMHGGDADLCLRARRLGAEPTVTPDATIIHHGGASQTVTVGKTVELLAGRATLIDRHWPVPLRPLGLHLLAGWPLSRWLASSAMAALTGSAPHRRSAAFWREIWDARIAWRFGYAKRTPIQAEIEASSPILVRMQPAL